MTPRLPPARCQTVPTRRPITRAVVRQGVIINRIRPIPTPPPRRARTPDPSPRVGLSICTPEGDHARPMPGTADRPRRVNNLLKLIAVGASGALLLAVIGGLATIVLLRWLGL